jgi:hypothetical protein
MLKDLAQPMPVSTIRRRTLFETSPFSQVMGKLEIELKSRTAIPPMPFSRLAWLDTPRFCLLCEEGSGGKGRHLSMFDEKEFYRWPVTLADLLADDYFWLPRQ